MSWERLRTPARGTSKNPNFQSLWEFGKPWKCSLSLKFKSANFQSIDEVGKVIFQYKFHCWK